jgi:hypothetical protein
METVMKGAMLGVALAAGFVCLMDVAGQAQETSTSSEVKNFEIVTVEGNQLVVKLPEGPKALTVPDDFRFTVNGKQVPVSELKPGMKGTATITTQTTVTPVSVTEVKNGTVFERSAGMITVQTPEGFKRFSQGDLDKRGVKIVKDGKPVNLEDLNKGDKLTATIVTSKPPRTMTKQEVQASVSEAAPAEVAAKPAPSRAAGTSGSAAAPATAAAPAPAKTLPKTASSWPLLALLSALSLATGLGLTIRRLARP